MLGTAEKMSCFLLHLVELLVDASRLQIGFKTVARRSESALTQEVFSATAHSASSPVVAAPPVHLLTITGAGVQPRAKRMIYGMAAFFILKEAVRAGTVQSGEEEAQDSLINMYKYLMGVCQEVGARLSSVVPSGSYQR